MHWVGAQDGCLDAERELILINQTPGDVVFISAADTDLVALGNQWVNFFGRRLRLTHAAPLRQPVAADHFVQTVVSGSRLLIARLLGGRSYFPHLIEALNALKEKQQRPKLLLLSSTGESDPDLSFLNDFDDATVSVFQRLLGEGGSENLESAASLAQALLDWDGGTPLRLPEVESMPIWGWYRREHEGKERGVIWLTFYRALYQTGDLEVVDSIFKDLRQKGFSVHAFFCQSLRESVVHDVLLSEAGAGNQPDIVLTMQSFAISSGGGDVSDFLKGLNCPVLQVPVSSSSREAWAKNPGGLSPAESAIQIALPEIDGRIMSTVAGFKEENSRLQAAECTLKKLHADGEQVSYVVQLAVNWLKLRRLPASQKRIAIILSNYPNRDGRIGNGVGLDTPESTLEVLKSLGEQGYTVTDMPKDGHDLMQRLIAGVTNDLAGSHGKSPSQAIPRVQVIDAIEKWPAHRCREIQTHWSEPLPEDIPVSGIQLGNIFIGIQPPRGFSLQTQAIYHSPDLPPPPQYAAFYQWVREVFKAHAVIHLGKHGNLEWLPGRALGLGEDDYPRLCLGPLPHLYPFIVNNPGEGTQAKRRTSAVIIDHLTPPLTRAGLYGQLEQLERLLEEHTHCVALYPRRAGELEAEMTQLLDTAPWRADLPDGGQSLSDVAQFLCELKESQIRSGLHIFGRIPSGSQAVDFMLSLIRLSSGDRPGLLSALNGSPVVLEAMSSSERDALDGRAREWIRCAMEESTPLETSTDLAALGLFVRNTLLPLLSKTGDEMKNLLAGLEGRFVCPGPAGAPTRGRVDVLPTGRNFYALDPRVVPTPTAWRCGVALANALLKRHFQDHGECLRTLAMVVWGTSNMRTGGDDLAQALWLWGCEPVWEENSGRVVDFKILPASLLGRPRVDITLRVSGLFRDAFGDTVRLLATIPKRLALLDEPEELNPIRGAWLRSQSQILGAGHESEKVMRAATLRVFTSGPGCYGTGMLPLIDAGNWETRADLAEVFIRWGNHAIESDGAMTPEPEALRSRLGEVQAIVQNQDNREHDILDSDDYFQFQGGLQAAIESIKGFSVASYHGDSSDPNVPKVRTLEEELVKVLHSRALNPRWINAMRQHGYKGAFELAATVDYLFGYSATTGLVKDHHFEAAAHTLLLDQESFFREHNPDALREATGRLLEAAQRGLWKQPEAATVAQLETALLSLETDRE